MTTLVRSCLLQKLSLQVLKMQISLYLHNKTDVRILLLGFRMKVIRCIAPPLFFFKPSLGHTVYLKFEGHQASQLGKMG